MILCEKKDIYRGNMIQLQKCKQKGDGSFPLFHTISIYSIADHRSKFTVVTFIRHMIILKG